MKTRITIVAAVIALASFVSAHAGVVFDSIDMTPDQSVSIVDFGPLAASFTSDSVPSNLYEVDLVLTYPEGEESTINVSLLSDSSNTPGTFISNIGTLSDAQATGILAVYTDTFTPIALAANTRYWIQLDTTNGSDYQWATTDSTSGIGVSGEFNSSSSGVQSNDATFQMRVFTDAAPEPSTIALLGFGGVAVIAFARRRLLAS